MKDQLWCQYCCIAHHPVMLTGYVLRSLRCERCGQTADLAIVLAKENME